MKLASIYEKSIVRNINPAITAQDLSKESIDIEIGEYVFTDEIINNLYKTLNTLKNKNSVDKTGIWINGYYGSGKSHFLKYLHYCMNTETQEKAFDRLVEAVNQRDPLRNPKSKSRVSNAEINDLKRWYSNAEIEDILFNAQDVAKAKRDENTFTYIFFNMFNKCRGYNSYNIPLAVLFEKYLDERGKFEEFKILLNERANFDWDKEASDIVRMELDTVLAVAKELVPSLDTESLKATLNNPETYHIDTAKFSSEVKKYLESKDKNYRLVFLVDEVSQFINDSQELLLDLQTIVESVSNECNKQVWFACTAQQTYAEMIAATGISKATESYGKIMGRFETRVSLESTDPAYITQVRILNKNSEGLTELTKLYNSNKDAIHNQFDTSHELYSGFKNDKEFYRSYPFIPYQFKLISQVFDAFQQKEFVVKEVKDNERSILKITHETAKKTMDWEVGSFIPFDEFYNNMFQQNLIHKGSKAINPTLKLVENDEFAKRVVQVLFMISNLNEKDQYNFKPTLDNLTLLLMKNVDENKLLLRNQIEEVLQHLIAENMIREEEGSYKFYNEDESELSTIIKNNTIGLEAKADIIKNILFPYINVESKYRFLGNDFKVSARIDGRNYFSSVSNDVEVSFLVNDERKAGEFAMTNNSNGLIVCISELFFNNETFKADFDWYCRVEDYISKNMSVSTGLRQQTIEKFSQRNKNLYNSKIKPAFYEMFDKSRFVSGQTVIEAPEVSGKGKDRYHNALDIHFDSLYKYAKLVRGLPLTADDLRNKVHLEISTSQKDILIPMTDAERIVDEYITRQGNDVLLLDLISHFSKVPYGWKDVTIIYIVTELVKRRLREIKYKNQLRYPVKDFITTAIKTSERSSLSIVSAQSMPQELINNAVSAWARIFNEHIPVVSDGSILFEELTSKLTKQVNQWQRLKSKYEDYPFSRLLSHLTDKLNGWLQIRDPKKFYETLIPEKDEAATLIDECRYIEDFINTQLSDYDNIKKFYHSNIANFKGLSDSDKAKSEQMRLFFENDYPVDNFRIIKKIHNELRSAINELLKDTRSKTLERYTKLFDNLDELAKTNNVPQNQYASRGMYLDRIEKEKDILQLQLKLTGAHNFENEQREAILRIANQIKLQEEAKKNTAGPIPQIVADPPESYELPRANKVLATESDIDDYIGLIRRELLEIIRHNKKIIIK